MSLTTAMEIARSNLNVLSAKTSVVSRNVANASTEFASRKIANTVTGAAGYGVRLGNITRSTNDALFHNLLSANSDTSRQETIVEALDRINATIGDTESDTSPAALIGKLSDAIQQYSAAPSDRVRGQAAISAAQDVVVALNSATETVQQVRTDADSQIADSVARINTLLSEYDQVNKEIIAGTRFDNDVTDYLDQRDRILSDLSKEIGIKTVSRDYNDMALFTDSGVTLYDGQPREVTFDKTSFYSATTTGNAVYVDGVPVTGSAATLSLQSGRIKGLTEIRDETAPAYQTQLDEMARGLIDLFAETDQVGTGSPVAGLFTNAGSTTVPSGLVNGLAASISIDPDFDSSQGGDPANLRDGKTYDYNTTGATGYSDRLRSLIDAFSTPRTFDASAQIGTNVTINSFAASSASWLGDTRMAAANALDYHTTVQERTASSLSKETGINLDYEMTILLDLEHSYQATTRLVDTIDKMYQYLLQAAG